MKKIFTLLLTLLCVTISQAQTWQSQDTLRLKHFSTWAIAPYVSAPFQYTDIKPISLSTKISGIGVNLEKHLSHYTSFQVGYFSAPIVITNEGLNYKIDLNQWDAKFYFHIMNGNTLRTWRNTQLYVYGGVGSLQHSSKIYNDSTKEELKSVNAKALVALVGAGAKYRIGNKTSVFIDGCANFTSSDRIDADIQRYSNNDGYFKMSVGMSYTFGKKRILEWDNPYQYLVPESVHDTTVVIKTIKYEAPAVVEQVKPDSAVIYYLTNSWTLEAPYLDELDVLLDRAKNNGYSVNIESYCDATGGSNTNQLIIAKRADNVFKYVNRVIEASKIGVSMYDETFAVYAPEARNRRVVVKLIK
jgi:outer membrane protein OmpA-like peptidoglycan-associated protein